METLVINVETREGVGKGAARRTRRAGKVPGVFYGASSATRSIALERRQFAQRLANLEGAHLIELRSGDPALDQRKVLLREVQIDPVVGTPLHVDFYEVALDKAIAVKVRLHFEGKPVGVTLGGILQPILRELQVNCLPTGIPDFISVDVSHLGIHDTVHLHDVTLPEGVTAVSPENEPVVTVVPPTIEVAPVAAEEAPAEGAATTTAATAAPAAEAGEAKKAEPKKPEGKK